MKWVIKIWLVTAVMGMVGSGIALALPGSGTEADPWRIESLVDFNEFAADANYWDDYTRLETDVNLAGLTYSTAVIAPDADNSGYPFDDTPFTGVFDGNDHNIINLTIDDGGAGNDYLGLFGYIKGENAILKNLGLVAPNVNSEGKYSSTASLAGYLEDGTVQGCYAHGANVSGYGRIAGLVAESTGLITDSSSTASVNNTLEYGLTGGLVAYNDGSIYNSHSIASVYGVESVGGLVGKSYRKGRVRDSYSIANVVGDLRCGGLIGWNYDGSVDNCYSVSNVSGKHYLGGLIGQNYYRATLSNSFAQASVTGTEYNIGGLVGTNDGKISNCYAHGNVEGHLNVGGLAGYSGMYDIYNCYSTVAVFGTGEGIGGLVGYGWDRGEVIASFWDTETSGQTTSDGGTGLVTNQMQKRSTFEDAGWDFVGESDNGIEDIWFIRQQDYPHLWWEGMKVPMKLTPRTLNCRSYGNWVKAHITLPEGLTISDVDSNRPAVVHSFGIESAPVEVFVNVAGLVEVEAAIEREAVCSLAGNWPEVLRVYGFLGDGSLFYGQSGVRMIKPGLNEVAELASYWLDVGCGLPEWCGGIDLNRDSIVNWWDYPLLLNSQVEFICE